MNPRDYDLRAFRIFPKEGESSEIPLGKASHERNDSADLDAEFWRDVAREERRSVFRCHECNGISRHHPNCPSADDGQDDEEECDE